MLRKDISYIGPSTPIVFFSQVTTLYLEYYKRVLTGFPILIFTPFSSFLSLLPKILSRSPAGFISHPLLNNSPWLPAP